MLRSHLVRVNRLVRLYNTSTREKLKGYEFYEKTLGSPKYIVGPMVEQSELAWRILSRRYNAQLCYTPMFHSKLFYHPIHGEDYRRDQWSTQPEDRPLIVQFCANDPDILLKAAKLVENDCDAVDLNLGCPQYIAKKGRYGSFLQDEWDTIHQLISTLDRELKVPVTAKIRVFESVSKSVEYAKMIESSGAQLLTVHGRLREQKGHHTGLADWSKIKAVKDAIKIPVIANGNILYYDDVQKCLHETGADGVMSAEGNLYNPTLFSEQTVPPLTYQIAQEYLEICRDLVPSTRPPIIKSHLFKLFHASLPVYADLRDKLSSANTFNEMWHFTEKMSLRLQREQQTNDELDGSPDQNGIRRYSPWRCQPYFRHKLPDQIEQDDHYEKRKKKLEEFKQRKQIEIVQLDNDLYHVEFMR